jgi:hypothetical protein
VTARLLREGHGESGAVAVVAAVTLTVLVLMAALVIDLGFMRADRVDSKSVADMAAAAAVVGFDASIEGSAQQACEDAVAFAAVNLGAEAVADANRSCEEIYPEDYVCDPLVAPDPPATYTIGSHRVEVVIPVIDDEPLMLSLDHGAFDGEPCDRVGVRIQRDRTFLLARVAGFADNTTTQGSVGRAHFQGEEKDFASLIVLKRHGCQTLVNAGNAVLEVLNLVRDEDGEPEPVTYQGTITVDTEPQGCSGSQKIIQSAGTSLTKAEGDIFAHSLFSTDPDNAYTYRPADVASGNLVPQPKPGPKITRALIDHLYNCLPDYSSATPLWSPERGNQGIGPCEPKDATGAPIEPPPPPFLKELDDSVEAVMDGEDDGWSVYPYDSDAVDCSGSGVTVTGGRWIVDCPTGFGPDDLTFRNVEHIIFKNGLEIGTNHELTIEGDADIGTTVTMFTKGLDTDGGELSMRNVFTYIREAPTAGSNGRIRVGGSTDRFAVMAPLSDDHCIDNYVPLYDADPDNSGMPPASCFAPLAFWSNFVGSASGNSLNVVNGDAAGGIIGTVFTPNSHFRFRGSGDLSGGACGSDPEVLWDLISTTAATLQLEGSQFFASSIDLPSGAEVGMCPSPDTTVGVPIRGSGLIR